MGSLEGSYQAAAGEGLDHRVVVACREEAVGFQDQVLQGMGEGRGNPDHQAL